MISFISWRLCPLQVHKHRKHSVHGLYLWVLLAYLLGKILVCFYSNFAFSAFFRKRQSCKILSHSFPRIMKSTGFLSLCCLIFVSNYWFVFSFLTLFFRPPKHSCQGCWSCRMDTLFAWTLSWPCQPSLVPLTIAPPKRHPLPLWRAWPWGCWTVREWMPQQSCPSTQAQRCFRAWESGQSRGIRIKHLILNESSEYTPN